MTTNPQKINPSQIQFLRPLDQLMKVYSQSDHKYFSQLFLRKKQLINHLMSIQIDPQKYFALISKIYKSQTPLKQYARLDLLSLRDKHKMNKQPWFQQLVNQTQLALTQQQAKYNALQAQTKNNQQPVNNQHHPVTFLNINLTEFTNLKLFDEFMNKYYETCYKQNFIELYEKKLRILQALQSGKLKYEHYLMISQKVLNQTKNQQVRKAMKNDIQMLADLHDNNIQEWIKQTIKQAKQQLPQQKQTYQMHKKGIIVNKRQPKVDIDLDNFAQLPIPDVDPSQCVSFIILDRYMKQKKNNPQLYITLYEKKQKLLAQLQDKKLTQQTYQEMLKRMMNSLSNQDLKEIYQDQLNDIQDVHQGNLKQWFDNIVQQTKISLMIQQDIYHQHKKNFKPKQTKKQQKTQQYKPQPKVQPKKQQSKQIPKSQNKKSDQSNSPDYKIYGYKVDDMFSLKVLQNSILQFQNKAENFIKLFGQKKTIINMMGKGQLDANKYKVLQQKIIQLQHLKQEIKDQIQFDLQSIQQDFDNDVQKWFLDAVQNIGTTYDMQLAKYQKLIQNQNNKPTQKPNQSITKKSGPQKSEKPSIQKQKQKGHKSIEQQNVPSPFNIDKLYSLKVIDTALTEHEANQKLYMKIFIQKQKIIKKMQNGQIDCQKYQKLQRKMLEVFSDNDQIKDQIQFDLSDINDMYDGDVKKWFQENVNNAGVGFDNQLQRFLTLQKKYYPIQQNDEDQFHSSHVHHEKYESPQKQFESKLSEASSSVNASSPKSKIRYYLHQMAPWQSLAKYYQKHKLDYTKNQLLKIYFTVPRHQIQDIIHKIQKQPDYNIVSYCKKFFPPITQAVFYQGTQNIQYVIKKGIDGCNKQIQQLKEYIKNIRKALNIKNLQKVKQKNSLCQQNIKYLTSLQNLKKSGKLIPIPLIQQVPVNYPNMDQFDYLEPTEIELKIVKIEGMKKQELMKIYFSGHSKFQSKVKSGDHNIVVKGKQDSNDNFTKILKGDTKCFSISLYQTGWFSNSKVGQQGLQTLFIRSNIFEGKVKIGDVTIYYESKVRMARNPLMTVINQIQITKYPPYEHSKKDEQQFIAKYAVSSKIK